MKISDVYPGALFQNDRQGALLILIISVDKQAHKITYITVGNFKWPTANKYIPKDTYIWPFLDWILCEGCKI